MTSMNVSKIITTVNIVVTTILARLLVVAVQVINYPQIENLALVCLRYLPLLEHLYFFNKKYIDTF